MSLEKPEQLPTGIGQAKLAEKAETLPAIHLKNQVSWVNKEMDLPFAIAEKEPTDLALFLTKFPYKNSGEETVHELEVHRDQWRNALIGRVIFKDKQGRLYRDIDQKGGGWVATSTVGKKLVVYPSGKAIDTYRATAASGFL